MECIVSIDESSRNLIMVLTWVPSLLIAALVFWVILRSGQRRGGAQQGVNRTLVAVGGGAGTLFITWGFLLWATGRMVCSS